MDWKEAVDKVAELQAGRDVGEYMNGAWSEHSGHVGPAEVVALLYGVDVKHVHRRLYTKVDKLFAKYLKKAQTGGE